MRPLPQSNRLLPRPTLRRRTGIFAGVAASAFQMKLTRQRRKKRELERQMAHAEASSRLSIMFDDPKKWRPDQHNPVLAFAKRYRPQDWELEAANRRALLPQARVMLNGIIRDVCVPRARVSPHCRATIAVLSTISPYPGCPCPHSYVRLLYLSSVANRRLKHGTQGPRTSPEQRVAIARDDALVDSTGSDTEPADGLTVADIAMELHKTHVRV